jgi:hypothetical protein
MTAFTLPLWSRHNQMWGWPCTLGTPLQGMRTGKIHARTMGRRATDGTHSSAFKTTRVSLTPTLLLLLLFSLQSTNMGI